MMHLSTFAIINCQLYWRRRPMFKFNVFLSNASIRVRLGAKRLELVFVQPFATNRWNYGYFCADVDEEWFFDCRISY